MYMYLYIYVHICIYVYVYVYVYACSSDLFTMWFLCSCAPKGAPLRAPTCQMNRHPAH